MPKEIEFKWISLNPTKLFNAIKSVDSRKIINIERIYQSYFSDGDIAKGNPTELSLRIRSYLNSDKYVICTKKRTGPISCEESECEVSSEIALAMHAKADTSIMKTRFFIKDDDEKIWEIDFFDYVINSKSLMNPQMLAPYCDGNDGRVFYQSLAVIELEVKEESDQYKGKYPEWLNVDEISNFDFSNEKLSNMTAREIMRINIDTKNGKLPLIKILNNL